MATPFEKLSRSALGDSHLDFSKPERERSSEDKEGRRDARKAAREEPDCVMTLRLDGRSRQLLEEMKFKRRMTYKELLHEAIKDLYEKYGL